LLTLKKRLTIIPYGTRIVNVPAKPGNVTCLPFVSALESSSSQPQEEQFDFDFKWKGALETNSSIPDDGKTPRILGGSPVLYLSPAPMSEFDNAFRFAGLQSLCPCDSWREAGILLL